MLESYFLSVLYFQIQNFKGFSLVAEMERPEVGEAKIISRLSIKLGQD